MLNNQLRETFRWPTAVTSGDNLHLSHPLSIRGRVSRPDRVVQRSFDVGRSVHFIDLGTEKHNESG